MNAATIRFTRQLLDLTQTEFGALVGVNQLAVTRWESDLQSPNKDSVRRIRTLLGDEVLAKIDAFMYEQELKVLKDSVKAQVAARATVKRRWKYESGCSCMRPLMVVNIHKLRGRPFLCAYVYDDNYLLAQVIAPATEMPLTKKMREVVWANCDDLPAFDVWTSDESIYLACLTASDITGHFKAQEETSETLRGIEDARTQEALIDLYELKDPNEKEQQNNYRNGAQCLLAVCVN